MLRSTRAPVCVWCAEQHNPTLGAIAYAGGRWYRSYVTGRPETLLLWDALNAYPGGRWSVADDGVWSTDDLVEGHAFGEGTPPALDLDQPVLWIGDAVYAASDLREADTAPLVTLVAPRQDRGQLDTVLAQDGRHHQWMALDGVYWRSDTLREELTIAQRATVVRHLEGLERDTGERRPILADDHGRALFLRLNDEDFFEALHLAFIGEIPSICDLLTARSDVQVEVRPARGGESPFWPWTDHQTGPTHERGARLRPRDG
jgi:hypothetical protein